MGSVASPSFDVNLPQDDDDRCDLGDNCSFGELAIAVAATTQPSSPPMGITEPNPLVEEALRCDDSDDEPAMIEGDSDEDVGTVPASREVPSSSGTQQYPPHFSNINLEDGSGVGPQDGVSGSYVYGSIGSSVGGEFQIGQIFQSKEEALLALKNYSIRRGVEYKVFESDHKKYHGKCKEFGNGCNWLIRVTNRRRKGPSCRALSGSDPHFITLNNFNGESVVPFLPGRIFPPFDFKEILLSVKQRWFRM
ncbi:hypothetical protein PIB30_040700 [Stylosanthes scabra]|uniref:Transposase MuDR plant domain-containing protein n=1 Tax=Stylosanthes scabra TaxID=79078 RepID=A0ABU6SFR4_9FABA|nr:hypothetical protein [Stylosanthes scabra]